MTFVTKYNCSFIIVDDMLDGDRTRRNKPCWYLLPDVGLRAANDASTLMALIHQILMLNFKNEPHCAEILNHFYEGYLQQCMAQYLDNISEFKVINIKDFTIENHSNIAVYKFTHTFKMPLCLALLLSNKYKSGIVEKITEVCQDMAKLYMIQNDYLDCYGEPDIQGKNEFNSDIQCGKCSWPAVTALRHCNAEQGARFVKYYGSAKPEHIKLIKQLYDDLHIPEIYKEEEKLLVESIVNGCNAFPKGISPEPLLDLLYLIKENVS